jgi:Tfp pilus assembly protein PilN
MSIVVNLLPDVRQAKLREHRRRQLASGLAVMIWVVCGVALVLMLVIITGQKVAINLATKDIQDKTSQLKQVTGLTDALTAEQHLAALPGLYGQRVYMTKFFDAYQQADPKTISISAMNIDPTNVLTVVGTSGTMAEIAKLDRALEGSNVKVGTSAAPTNSPYFSNVSISSDSRAGNKVNFTIKATLSGGITQAAGSIGNANGK